MDARLDALAATRGPGSFTGLRVGISAAKGLCHGLEIPIIGISSLEALAAQMLYSELPVTPVLYSRKNEVYTAQFTLDKDGDTTRCMADAALRIEDLPLTFKDPSLFIGNDYANQGPAVIEVLGPMALLAPAHCWNLRASTIGALGLKRLHARDFDDPLTLEPLYLRPPDIRPNPFPVMADS